MTPTGEDDRATARGPRRSGGVARCRGRDEGAAAVFLVPAVMMIVVIALAVMVPLGGAVLDRRTASTSADAAALAAAGEWRDQLERVHQDLLDADSAEEFWDLLGHPLGYYRSSAMRSAAQDFAARNASVLVDYSADSRRGTVHVTVRSAEPEPTTGHYARSSATAEVRLERGLCLSNGLLGVLLNGTCRTSSPPEPPAPSPTPTDPDDDESPEPEPEPEPTFETPSGLDPVVVVRTWLVAG